MDSRCNGFPYVTTHRNSLRNQIGELLDEGRWAEAHARLGDFWRQEGKAAVASYVISCYERMKGHLNAVNCRISFLRSMTVEPLMPILRSAALVSGIDPVDSCRPIQFVRAGNIWIRTASYTHSIQTS